MFEPTEWSLVLAAGRSRQPAADAALARLCETYWRPLYAFVRSRGRCVEDAEDLTQAFFAHLIEKRAFERARRERGRFRAFLIVSLKHFLANEWDRTSARKRGGQALTLDLAEAERMLAAHPSDASPERIYERQWARGVLDAALARVRGEYAAKGDAETFDALKGVLGGGRQGEEDYRQLGPRLGLSSGAVRVAAHRLRQRYRRALRAVVGGTLDDASQVDDEIRHLLSVVAAG